MSSQHVNFSHIHVNMPPRALIGRRQRPSRLDILVARGFSYQLNPRNIEYDWYPAWTHALQKALPSRSDVALTAQYCTWISPQDQAGAGDEEEPDTESEDEPDEDWEDDEAGMDDEDSDHDSEFMDLGDPEDGSSPPMDDEDEIPSDDTIPAGPETRSQIIDFAILKLATEQLDDVEKHPDGTPRSFIVTNSDVEAIVEIKRYMSRRIPYTRTEILKELGKAQAQLILQAAHIFAQSDSQVSSYFLIPLITHY